MAAVGVALRRRVDRSTFRCDERSDMPANRRDFLCAAAAGTAAAASRLSWFASSAVAKDPSVRELLPIVDTHQHLWDLKQLELPWLKGDAVAEIRRSYLTTDYAEATKGLNVVKSIYMEVNVAPSDQVKEAEFVLELCRGGKTPMVAAVIGGSPQDRSFGEYIAKFQGNPFLKGVRTVLHDPDRPKGMCLEPTFVDSMKRLGDQKLSFDLCMRSSEIADGARLAEKCPGTKFIVDHCGNMDVTSTDPAARRQWMDGMKAAASLPNTACKISGIVVTEGWKPADLAPNIDFCLETFGDDRVFFGGDWPVCTLKSSYAQWVAALKEIVSGRTREFQKKLFHDNAVAFYGLK